MKSQNSKACAEVIESSLHQWMAQSWQWDYVPPFGSLLVTEYRERTVFGIVHQIGTGSMDPMRYPFAYQKTHEELLREQPQIFEFLKTTFSCITVGFKEGNKLYYQLAPEPPLIHTFVAPANAVQFAEFFSNEQYIHLIFAAAAVVQQVDELVLAVLRQQVEHKFLSVPRVERLAEHFCLLTGNDYRRLKMLLQRVEGLL
jgi:hypothetical protein